MSLIHYFCSILLTNDTLKSEIKSDKLQTQKSNKSATKKSQLYTEWDFGVWRREQRLFWDIRKRVINLYHSHTSAMIRNAFSSNKISFLLFCGWCEKQEKVEFSICLHLQSIDLHNIRIMYTFSILQFENL